MKHFTQLALLGCLVFIFFSMYPFIDNINKTEDSVSNYYIKHGVIDIGAINIVSSIYLGYRAYDTLGESIVLLLAVIGVYILVNRDERRI